MDVYIYRASLLCEPCAERVRSEIPFPSEPRFDSDRWPAGPYPHGGGEADTPQHCGRCGRFLENPLTDEGYADVIDALAAFTRDRRGDPAVLAEWAEFYRLPFYDAPLDYDGLKFEYNTAASGSDPWGDCMSAWFAVAGEIYARGITVPAEWRYRPGVQPRTLEDYFSAACAFAADADLLRFGAVLDRYARMLRYKHQDD